MLEINLQRDTLFYKIIIDIDRTETIKIIYKKIYSLMKQIWVKVSLHLNLNWNLNKLNKLN